jgi:hypothetical protein
VPIVSVRTGSSLASDEIAYEFVVPGSLLTRPRARSAVFWAEAKEYWGPTGSDGARTLRIPVEDWKSLAAGSTSEEPEAVEQWSHDHEAVARLAQVGSETLSIRSEGYVGGPSLRVSLEVLERGPLNLTSSAPGRYLGRGGQRIVLSPVASALADLVIAFAAEATHDEPAQLRMLAEMKRLRAASTKLDEDAPRLRVHLDEHLDSFDVIEPRRVRARWIEEGPNRISLKLFADDSEEPISLGSVSPDGSVISELPNTTPSGSKRQRMLLDPATAAVMQRARSYDGVRTAKVDPALLESPLGLVPEGMDAPKLDFSDYGHRVLGFAPATRDASAGEASGVVWYRNDIETPEPLALTFEGPDGAVELKYESAAEAAQDLRRLEIARRSGAQSADLQGFEIHVSDKNLTHARAVLDRWNSGAEASLTRQTETPAEHPQNTKSKRLQAVLADVSTDATAPADSAHADIEAAVPWHLLRQVLAPGVELKPHQRTGIAWLWHRYLGNHAGAMLADDMGLGKTLQIACFIALTRLAPRPRAHHGPSLVVAPVVLVPNWDRELVKFFIGAFPGRVKLLTSDAVKGLSQGGSLDRTLLQTLDIVVTTYDVLARHQASLLAMSWNVVVLDEAHKIKNRGTQWSVAARGLSGMDVGDRPRKFVFGICATGTPVENSVGDLWAQYDFLAPGRFGPFAQFETSFVRAENGARRLATQLCVGSLQSSLLRRDKKQLDLPPKVFRSVPIPMTPRQRELEKTIIRQRTQSGPLGVLQRLQQLYQHPWLLESDERDLGSIAEALAASPKLVACVELLRDVRDRGEKALVFTLWTRMQFLLKTVIEHELRIADIPIINGEPKNVRRAQDHIDALSRRPGFGVMILSPLAAGTGLNITAANHVIHYGRWWNPAKEDQATDRAHRIGQARPVTVYYPVLHHADDPNEGFDVKLDELVSRKRAMARDLLEPQIDADISDFDLKELGFKDE